MSSLKRLLSIGYKFQDPRAQNTEFHEPDSALGHDLIYWDPARFGEEYGLSPGNLEHEGRIDRPNAVRADSDIDRRSAEFREHLDAGKPIVVAVPPPRRMWFLEGRIVDGKQVGRKIQLTSLLPTQIQLRAARGEAFELAAGEPFAKLWHWIKDVVSYESYFIDPPGTPLLKIRETDRVVATAVQAGSSLVLYLPRMGNEVGYGDSPYSPLATENRAHTDYLDLLWEVCKELGGKALVPEWTNAYLLPGEGKAVTALSRAHSSLRRAQRTIEKREDELRELRERKILVTGTGAPLEQVVSRALESLGFSVEAGPPGRTDRIIRRKRRAAVVEIKGKSKSASEKDAAQLEKWKSNFHADYGRIPKGILIVNAWRGKSLAERSELEAFPDQMLQFAVNERRQCLLTTIQLLALWLEAEKSKSRADKLARELLACEGVFPTFQDWSDVFELESDES